MEACKFYPPHSLKSGCACEQAILKYLTVVENKRLHGRMIEHIAFVLSREHVDAEKTLQVSCCPAFIEADLSRWDKKIKSGDYKSTKESSPLLFPLLPLALISVPPGVFLRCLSTVSSSCNGGFCCVPLKEICTVKCLWGFADGSGDGCVVCVLPLTEAIPPSYSASSLFYSYLGSCRGESENDSAEPSYLQVRLKKIKVETRSWKNQAFISCAACQDSSSSYP